MNVPELLSDTGLTLAVLLVADLLSETFGFSASSFLKLDLRSRVRSATDGGFSGKGGAGPLLPGDDMAHVLTFHTKAGSQSKDEKKFKQDLYRKNEWQLQLAFHSEIQYLSAHGPSYHGKWRRSYGWFQAAVYIL